MSEQKMENPYDKFGAHPCKVTAGRGVVVDFLDSVFVGDFNSADSAKRKRREKNGKPLGAGARILEFS